MPATLESTSETAKPRSVFILRFISTIVLWSIALFIAFMIRNLYFVTFELAWRGATPGKRMVGLRVIDRAGGPLQPSAVDPGAWLRRPLTPLLMRSWLRRTAAAS